MHKLNLGCGDQVIPEWENLDPRASMFPGAKPWSWNEPLPYPDGSAELVLIQHALMYCAKDDYERNLVECARVLAPGGKIVVKEDNDRLFTWRKIGTKHATGTIRSHSNDGEMEALLLKCGFEAISGNCEAIIAKYGSAINRQRKLRHGIVYVLEAERKRTSSEAKPDAV